MGTPFMVTPFNYAVMFGFWMGIGGWLLRRHWFKLVAGGVKIITSRPGGRAFACPDFPPWAGPGHATGGLSFYCHLHRRFPSTNMEPTMPVALSEHRRSLWNRTGCLLAATAKNQLGASTTLCSTIRLALAGTAVDVWPRSTRIAANASPILKAFTWNKLCIPAARVESHIPMRRSLQIARELEITGRAENRRVVRPAESRRIYRLAAWLLTGSLEAPAE